MKASVKYRVIYRHKDKYAVVLMCKFFNVSRSGYYDFVCRMDQPDRDEPLRMLIEERRAGRYGKRLDVAQCSFGLNERSIGTTTTKQSGA